MGFGSGIAAGHSAHATFAFVEERAVVVVGVKKNRWCFVSLNKNFRDVRRLGRRLVRRTGKYVVFNFVDWSLIDKMISAGATLP
jgi:glucosamine 6-phosphate synthetase-like amidotransferase/phosphosugar isomerase protein